MPKSDDGPIVPDRQAEPTASPGELAISCLPLILIAILLVMLGRCIWGGGDEPQPASSPTSAATLSPAPATAAKDDTMPVGSNALEQAIFDAFPVKPAKGKKARQRVSNAADYIGATINSAGHLCARPIQAQQVATGQYGIGCRKYREAGGQANYIVDVRTGNVSEI